MCWYYEHSEDVRAPMVRFLAEGLVRGERVCFVSDREFPELGEWLARMAGGVSRPGAVQSMLVFDRYRHGAVVDAQEQVRQYAMATRVAREAGFTGLRVAAEATALVGTAAQRDAFARYEYLIDAFMMTNPFAAMCAYNRTRLGAAAVAELACLHPRARAGATAFHLHAGPRGLVLRGELDMAGWELLPHALEHVELRASGGELRLDARNLTFIDHRNLITLANFARARGVVMVLDGAGSGAVRVASLLGLDNLRVEPVI